MVFRVRALRPLASKCGRKKLPQRRKESSQEKEMTNLMSWWRDSGNADRTKHYETVHIFIGTIVVYIRNGNNWSQR